MKIKEGGVMDIQKLTKEQAVIISGFTGILCGEFSDFHADVEKRLGRGVQTFEFGFKEFATEVKKLYEADFIEMGTVDKEQAKAQAVPEKDAVIKNLSDQLYAQEMKTSAARTLCETACELLDDYAHQDAMVILNDLEQAMKEPAND